MSEIEFNEPDKNAKSNLVITNTTKISDLLKTELLNKRSKLSESSVKTYVSTLKSLYKKLKPNSQNFKKEDIIFFSKGKKQILNHLKDKLPNERKTVLSALYILTNDEEYRKIMLQDCNNVNEKYKNQIATENEKNNWLSLEQIKKVHDDLLVKILPMLKYKDILDEKLIIDYLIISIMSGIHLPPRRSLDICLMKIRNYDKNKDNYYENGKFYYNNYKTYKVYGQAIVDVKRLSPKLDDIIKRWIKINKTDYLIYSTNKKPLSPSQIYQYNDKIWGKPVSTNMYRKIYLTEFYKTPKTFLEMQEMAKYLGHSINTSMVNYVKIDKQ